MERFPCMYCLCPMLSRKLISFHVSNLILFLHALIMNLLYILLANPGPIKQSLKVHRIICIINCGNCTSFSVFMLTPKSLEILIKNIRKVEHSTCSHKSHHMLKYDESEINPPNISRDGMHQKSYIIRYLIPMTSWGMEMQMIMWCGTRLITIRGQT